MDLRIHGSSFRSNAHGTRFSGANDATHASSGRTQVAGILGSVRRIARYRENGCGYVLRQRVVARAGQGEGVGVEGSDPFSREADVILLRKGVTIEARVDIAGRNVESWKERKDVQAPTFDNEFFPLGEEAKNDPQLHAALVKHGVKD